MGWGGVGVGVKIKAGVGKTRYCNKMGEIKLGGVSFIVPHAGWQITESGIRNSMANLFLPKSHVILMTKTYK